jgi:hypothetical protein
MTEIEQIKQERDQAIAAALKLRDAVAEHIGAETYPNEIALAVREVESIAPKRKPMECWVTAWRGYSRPASVHTTKGEAEQSIANRSGATVHHIREVLPWKRWIAYDGPCEIGTGEKRIRHYNVSEICEAHNAEMERITGTKGEA